MLFASDVTALTGDEALTRCAIRRRRRPSSCRWAHDDRPWCPITTLVVDEAHRGHGIGQMLVEAAEKAARDASCSRIEATSALHRDAAHGFYERLGYGRNSAHFLKPL